MKFRFSDILISFVVIGVVLLIIIPVPASVLDVLITFNIMMAIILVLNTIYSKEALDLSVFPSLLLFTTIARLSINISTTRRILLSGDPGKVVTAFGQFVAGGNVVIGIIMFLIIIIVQFMVITKGAERVSEVAARFTLDAMPGKQMAIDADLNSGLINEQQAKDRRKKIQLEADFYGSMDGASKFVKGDAIAAILIAAINIVAGFILGAMRGEGSALEVFQKYTIFTVGDGLVSQIPALLISTATGIIVTRAGADDSDLSKDIFRQILREPKVMFITAGVLLILVPVPGMPWYAFVILAAGLIFLGLNLRKSINENLKSDEVTAEDVEVEEIRKPENVMNLLQVDPIELEFGYGIIPLADVNQGGDLLDRVVMIRRQIALELGIVVPTIRLRDNIQLTPNEYVIKIRGVEISRGSVMFDHYMAMNPGIVEDEIQGIPTKEPAFGLPALWITQAQKEKAEILGYTVVDPPSIISTHLSEVVKSHAYELLGRQEVQALIDNVKETNSVLVEELIPKLLTVGEVQKVLANLLIEGISIRDLVTILETLADYSPNTRDADLLTEYVRQAMSRYITRKYVPNGIASVITVDSNVEQTIMDSVKHTETGSYLAIDPNVAQEIVNSLSNQLRKINVNGEQPIVLASPVVRMYLKRMTEQFAPGLVVLSYNELERNVEIQSVGMVSI